MPSSHFTVSRTAFRDNSSKYTYNGKTMQFKDIAVLLRGVGIDLIHNRFLILQVLLQCILAYFQCLLSFVILDLIDYIDIFIQR